MLGDGECSGVLQFLAVDENDGDGDGHHDHPDRDHDLMLLVEMICMGEHAIPSHSASNKPSKGRCSSASIPAHHGWPAV